MEYSHENKWVDFASNFDDCSKDRNYFCKDMYYILKILISALLIVAISELAKRSSLMGAIVASIPLVSIMAMIWLYIDTQDVEKISAFSVNIFWLILPSLVLFIALSVFLKIGWGFYVSLSISITIMIASYFAMIAALNYFGIKI